jgi:DNA repair exonuclease SbcCD ATPase subunit
MAKENRLAEYIKHIEVVTRRKSEEQIAEENAVFYIAERNLMDDIESEAWQEKERAIIRADEAHKAEVEKSFDVLRGRLSVDACLEEACLLLQSIKAKVAGKAVQFVEPVANLGWLDSEHVTAADVEQAEAVEREALAVVEEVKARIERNGEAIRKAVERIGGDEALAKKLSKLEAQRKKALLAGSDLSKLNAEIMNLRYEIEENKMAVGIAEQDVETLKVHAETLDEVLAAVEEIAAHITAKAAALFAHSKVVELNRLSAELAGLAQEVADAKARTCWRSGALRRTLCASPSCGESELMLPLWRGRSVVPNFKGGKEEDKGRVVVRVRFN